MRRKALWIAIGCVVVLIAVPLVWLKIGAARLDREYRTQLRLAHEEGLPATGAEIAATLHFVPDSQNAEPYYLRLANRWSLMRHVDYELSTRLVFAPTEAGKREARDVLARMKPSLDLVDKAATYPHCRFERDWSQGIAILFPEVAYIKDACKLLLLRASLAASDDRPAQALADAREAMLVSRHLQEDPLPAGKLVARSIYSLTLRHLAYWSFVHRDRPGYRRALESALAGLALPDLQAEHRFDLFEVLSVIDLCSTPEGRKQLGLKEENLGRAEQFFPLLQSRGVGRVKVVKAAREYWAALQGPQKDMGARIGKAEFDLFQGLISFPTAGQIYGMLGDSWSSTIDEVDAVKARKLTYRAFLRGLSSNFSKPVNTADLIGPWDGKPIRYRFDGTRVMITVDAGKIDGGVKLTIPPAGF